MYVCTYIVYYTIFINVVWVMDKDSKKYSLYRERERLETKS